MATQEQEIDLIALKNAVESASVALVMADADHRITYINEAARRIFTEYEVELRKHFPGFSVSRVVGSNIDIFHKNPAHQRAMLADARNFPHKARIEVGRLVFDLTVAATVDDDGKITGHTVEWVDMTDAAKAEAEHAEAVRNMTTLKQATDMASTALMLCDPEYNITYANNATLDILRRHESDLRSHFPGFTIDSVVGSNMDRFHRDPSHQRRMLSDRNTSTHVAKMSVGNAKFQITASRVEGPDGSDAGFILEWKDLTDQVAAESSLDSLIESAANGYLDKRFDTSTVEGFIKRVGEGINKLLEALGSPLAEVRSVTEAIAEGKLTKTVQTAYEGDFGVLAQSLNRSIENLQGLVGEITHSSGEIARAAGEISAGNANLSSRTQEQAAALEETAATVEELTSTVKQNAENARNAEQVAATARDSATSGGKVVTQAVEAMSEINRSSKRIADIIGVIDEIAFQTNLLALNAAVEAARAGDQGRGFAVVATEVRNLAQRSANAAREIKTLIKDSLDKVEHGTKLVDRSGATLGEIVSGVKKVSDIVAEIAAASDEQASGIEQVNEAVAQMDDATQQNAALVEEAAAAAAAMDDQTKNLQTLVNRFEVSSDKPAAAAAAPAPAQAAPASAPRPVAPAPVVARAANGAESRADEWEEF